MVLNIHHLELFYYVARHGGITAALRHIPYGIQQPAVSSQIAQLETEVGGVLFQRRPFVLSERGREVFAHIEPFFRGLPELADRLAHGSAAVLRLGASNAVLRDHLPPLLSRVTELFPDIRLTSVAADQESAERGLSNAELDYAVVVLERTPARGLRCVRLLELPLALALPPGTPAPRGRNGWMALMEKFPLIAPHPGDPVPRLFQRELAARGLKWDTAIEASSLDVVSACVSEGLGVGLTLEVPGQRTRALRLPGFPRLVAAALWRGKPTPPVEALHHLVESEARRRLGF